MKILSDQPIQHKSEDTLDRVSFAEHLAIGLLNWKSKDSLCVALHGPWGSGKTSIINLCLEVLKEKTKDLPTPDKPIIIRFQPWLIAEREQLIKSFLDQLRKALGKPELSEFAKEASKKLEAFENLLGYASWIPKAGGFFEKIKGYIGYVKGTAQTISQQLKEDLESNKESICSALSNLHSPLIITIDDIDRLPSQEIRQLFQLIKAIADFPNTIYVLAFDHKLVEKALEPFQAGSEIRYLEKIVQLDFEVPTPSRSKIVTILFDELDDIIKTIPSDKYEQERWNEIRFGLFLPLFRNIRDIKRYLNAVRFKFPIIQGEVNSLDLLIVEAIHLFAPELYKAIKDSRDYLISGASRASFSSQKDKNDWFMELPKLSPEYCRQEIKELLSYLFPEVESAYKKHSWGSGSLESWDKNQRICVASFFDFYFHGALPEDEVSKKEANKAIELLNDRTKLTLFLNNYMSDCRITKLLPMIEYYLEEHRDIEAIRNLIISIFESGENLPFSAEGFAFQTDWIIQGTIYRSLKLLDKHLRKDMLLEAMSLSNNAVVFPLSEASYIWKQWNPSEGDGDQITEEKLLCKEESEEIKNAALSLIQKYKNTERLYKSRHLHSTLYYWETWSSSEEVREWVGGILSDEKKIPEFLRSCGGFTRRSSIGSHYMTTTFVIPIKDLSRFCDIEQLKERCKSLLKNDSELTWLTNEYKVIIKAFLDSMDMPENPIKRYL